MPAYYDYRCTVCGKIESRYRNARRSRCCRADLVRLDPPAATEPSVKIEIIDGVTWRVQKVTGEIARILTGRNSYVAYRRLTPLPHEQATEPPGDPDLDPHRRELATFLQGKTIAGLRFDAEPGPGAFDLILTDGSEVELYVIGQRLTWVLMTAEEIAEQDARDAEQDARDIRELDAQLADLRSGKAPLYDHDEVWAEIDAEAREAGAAT